MLCVSLFHGVSPSSGSCAPPPPVSRFLPAGDSEDLSVAGGLVGASHAAASVLCFCLFSLKLGNVSAPCDGSQLAFPDSVVCADSCTNVVTRSGMTKGVGGFFEVGLVQRPWGPCP